MLPDATFVGIDTSGRAIARARELADTLGVENARFEQVAIEGYEPAAGAFDYVVAHGVFSCVPEPVRDRLLALCEHVLDGHGVAYVSCNALPGARVPQTLRELLLMKLEGVDDPAERIAGARLLLTLLSGDNQNATMLGAEAAALLAQSDAFLFHDALAPFNEPVLFGQFAARAAVTACSTSPRRTSSRCRSGCCPRTCSASCWPTRTSCAASRCSTISRCAASADAAVRCSARPRSHAARESLRRLAVSSPAQATVEDASAPERVTFTAPGGSRLTTEHPVVVAALTRATRSWPQPVPVGKLLRRSARAPGSARRPARSRAFRRATSRA